MFEFSIIENELNKHKIDSAILYSGNLMFTNRNRKSVEYVVFEDDKPTDEYIENVIKFAIDNVGDIK